MSVLVTGGAGFIGSHLIGRLLSAGQDVVCVDSFSDYYDPAIKWGNISSFDSHPRFSLHEVDILDGEALKAVCVDHGVESVVHLAAMVGVRASLAGPLDYQRVNVGGSIVVLELCRVLGVKKVVFASSSSVYGANEKIPFSEDDRVENPRSPYAVTKRAGELLFYCYHRLYGLDASCLRLFTVYGPRQRPDMAIHKFTAMIAARKPIPVYGDGLSSRDYTYVDDIVDGILAAFAYRGGCEIFNLGDSRMIELRALIRLIESGLGKEAKIERLPDQTGDVPRTYADIAKARRLLSYEPKVAIEDGVARFIDWYTRRKSNNQETG